MEAYEVYFGNKWEEGEVNTGKMVQVRSKSFSFTCVDIALVCGSK